MNFTKLSWPQAKNMLATGTAQIIGYTCGYNNVFTFEEGKVCAYINLGEAERLDTKLGGVREPTYIREYFKVIR